MFVSGHEVPLVEIVLAMGIITAIILIEVIVILVLLIYHRKQLKK
jgi:hypothetical protein